MGRVREGEGVQRSGATDQPALAAGQVFTHLGTYQIASSAFAIQVEDDQGRVEVLHLTYEDGSRWALVTTDEPDGTLTPFGGYISATEAPSA